VTSTTTRVDSAGRIVIPAEVRKELGLRPGSEVMVRFDDGELRVTTRKEALRRAQDLVCRLVPKNVSLADELIAERRAEAKRELAD
jgi:AbrB family looped-hinge helix DNA binding protein